MSANPPAETAAPTKSKKKLIIAGGLVLLLVVAGAVAWWLLANRHHGEEDGGASGHQAQPAAPKTPPTFLPIENMVVNLADPGGDRFAQIGVTLELADTKTDGLVKQFLPSIRNGILMLVSQRTSEELLGREGKEKLALDILHEVSATLGITEPKPSKKVADRDPDDEEGEDAAHSVEGRSPVRRVLFSSFIIQ